MELEVQKCKPNQKSDGHKGTMKQQRNYDKPKFASKKEEVKTSDSKDKLAALKSYRRANGLSFTCGEKWAGKAHNCLAQISLHVIQELIDAVQPRMTHIMIHLKKIVRLLLAKWLWQCIVDGH